jgi:hypothetical protein
MIIIVTSEEEDMFIEENGKRTGEIMPIYNVMLEEYQPNIKHLSDIENMVTRYLLQILLLHAVVQVQYFFHLKGIRFLIR